MTTPATTGHAQSSTLGYPDNTPLHLAQATDLTRLLEKACSALEELIRSVNDIPLGLPPDRIVAGLREIDRRTSHLLYLAELQDSQLSAIQQHMHHLADLKHTTLAQLRSAQSTPSQRALAPEEAPGTGGSEVPSPVHALRTATEAVEAAMNASHRLNVIQGYAERVKGWNVSGDNDDNANNNTNNIIMDDKSKT